VVNNTATMLNPINVKEFLEMIDLGEEESANICDRFDFINIEQAENFVGYMKE
jgi:hypothetical protein